MKNYIFLFLCLSLSLINYAQTSFFEDFNYSNYTELEQISQKDRYKQWKFVKKDWRAKRKLWKKNKLWKEKKILWKEKKERFKKKESYWYTRYADPVVDLSMNGKIEEVELFKKTEIIIDPFDANNKIIQFELNRIDPYFFARYKCCEEKRYNIIEDRILKGRYSQEKDSYCIGCNKSRYNEKNTVWRNHMVRNELATFSKGRMFQPDVSYWIGLKMLIDEQYEFEKNDNQEIVTQFHLLNKGKPPVAIIVEKESFKLAINNNVEGITEYHNLGKVEKNKWINWKFHIVFSENNENGIVEIWKDNIKLHSIKGKNIIQNLQIYLKIGIYKWGWWDCGLSASNGRKKIVSYDDVWANNHDILRQR